MNEIRAWLERQARREQRAVYLEEALLGRRFPAYAFYRLRYFFARYAVASATHAVTVLLLYRFFDRRHFVLVLVVYAAASLVSSFWWGSLEAMRGEVRRLYRLRAPHLIPKEIGRWLSLSLQLTVLTTAGTAAWVALHLLRAETLGPAGLYVFAILLRLSLQFFTRCYHSGVYAIRRIYRPLPAILGVEVVGGAVALALAPFLGAWSLPVGALLAVPVIAGLSIYFTSRTYRFLGLSPFPYVRVARLVLPPRRALPDLLGGGISCALVALDSLLVLVLFTTEKHSVTKTGLFAFFFLISPTVRASFEWAQLLYFDLKRLEIRLFRNLKKRFERDVLRLAVVLGVFFAGVATMIGALVYEGSVRDLAWVLVPFFVSICLLAAVQIEAYSERAYLVLATNASLCLAGFLAAARFVHDERATVLALAGAAFGAFATLQLRRERLDDGTGRGLLWPSEWLVELGRVGEPVHVAAASFFDATTIEEDRWRQWRVAERIARELRHSGRATLIEPGLLVWYERASGPRRITVQSLQSVGSGLLKWVGSTATERNGGRALWSAARDGLLGKDLKGAAAASPIGGQELRAAFERTFTSAIVYAPDAAIPARLDALRKEDKRLAVVDAIAFARELRPRRSRSHFQVTALCEAGELRLIFLVSRHAPTQLRSRWEATIRRANLRAALALPEAEAGGSVTPPHARRRLPVRLGLRTSA